MCKELLIAAIRENNIESVRSLLASGVDADVQGAALTYATWRRQEEMVELLIANGARVDVLDEDGWNALIHAANWGHEKIVELLIANGAGVNVTVKGGKTALMCAAWNGHTEIVRLLLAKGAMIDVADNEKWTALIFAASWGHKKIVELLIANGANVNAVDIYRATALMRASLDGHEEIIELLIANGAMISFDYARNPKIIEMMERESVSLLVESRVIECRKHLLTGCYSALVEKYQNFVREEIKHFASLRSQIFLHVIQNSPVLKEMLWFDHEAKPERKPEEKDSIILLKGAYREASRFARFGEMGGICKRWVMKFENGHEAMEKRADHPRSSYSDDFAESLENSEKLQVIKERIARILEDDDLSLDDALFALYFINYDYVNVVKNLESNLGKVADFVQDFVKEMEEKEAQRELELLEDWEKAEILELIGKRIRGWYPVLKDGEAALIAKYEDFARREVALASGFNSRLFLHVINYGGWPEMALREEKYAEYNAIFWEITNSPSKIGQVCVSQVLKFGYKDCRKGAYISRDSVILSQGSKDWVFEKIYHIFFKQDMSLQDVLFALHFIKCDYINRVKNLCADAELPDVVKKIMLQEKMGELNILKQLGLAPEHSYVSRLNASSSSMSYAAGV